MDDAPTIPLRPIGRVLRVAVASRDGKTVHEHFGRATMFQIFDIEEGVARFVESRPNAPTCRGGSGGAQEEDEEYQPQPDLPQSIADCCAVLVAAIGPGARYRLERNHLRAFVERDFIEPALARVARKLAEDPRGKGPS